MKNNFRVVIPRGVDYFLILTKDIIDKDNADGANSKLKSIEMARMAILHQTAVSKHNEAEHLKRQKDIHFHDRNMALGIAPQQKSYTPNTVLYYVTSVRDYLTGIFKGKEKQLGDWGFKVDEGKRKIIKVPVSRNPDKLMDLAKSILAKHEADGIESILTDFDMLKFKVLLDEAVEHQALAKEIEKKKEKVYQERNRALGFGNSDRSIKPDTLLYFVTSIRDVLKGFYKGIEQSLGEWGFEVNTSPVRKHKNQHNTVQINGKVLISETHEGIEGVTVYFHATSGLTQVVSDADGTFKINLKPNENEFVIATVNHSGFMPFSEQLEDGMKDEVVLDVKLIQIESIK